MKNFTRRLIFFLCLMFSVNLSHAQWVMTGEFGGGILRALAVSGSTIYAGAFDREIWKSTDNGSTWNIVNSSLPNVGMSQFAIMGTTLFVGGTAGLSLSRDNGTTWTYPVSGAYNIFAIVKSDSVIFAGSYGGFMYRSSDNGTTWTQIPKVEYETSLAASGNDVIVAGTLIAPGDRVPPPVVVYYSTDNGITWTETGNDLPRPVVSLSINGSIMYAGTGYDGVYTSSDHGAHWVKGSLTSYVKNFYASEDGVYANTQSDGIYYSTDKGVSWKRIIPNLTGYSIQTIAVNGTTLFAATVSGIFRCPISEISDVGLPCSLGNPKTYSLSENYPNPFNPSTTISFSLPSRSFVSLKIFDVMGRDVATVVSEEMSAGSYSRQWNASGMPSGMYFYRLQAGTYTETKRLTLMK